MKRYLIFLALAMMAAVLTILLARESPVFAGEDSCDPIIASLHAAIQTNTCQQVATGYACYGNQEIDARLRSGAGPFSQPGQAVEVIKLRRLNTLPDTGAALMYVNSPDGEVKIIVFGNTDLSPDGPSAFTMRKTGGAILCEKTPSGMMVQTDSGKPGRVMVNGVRIDLESTAFISMDSVVLFDQDPRIGRRFGSPNPNAALCSGFDSECNFGNCPNNYRLVWGPFCDEKRYPYIQPGAYRVTLEGVGTVQAGATDWGISMSHFAFGQQVMNLPGSFTFCWEGLQPGGYGFETVVKSRSPGARIDHMTVEYLGPDCAMSGAEASSRTTTMTVTNLEGKVAVAIGDGPRQPIPVGYQSRITLVDGEPVAIGEPVPAVGLRESPVLNWLTFDERGLPWVNEGEGGCGGDLAFGVTVVDEIPSPYDTCAYTFRGKAGEIISAEMDRLGGSLDPRLDLVAPDGRTEKSDDDSAGGKNSLISGHRLRQSGQYTLVARSNEEYGDGRFSLLLVRGFIEREMPTATPTPTPRPTSTPTRRPPRRPTPTQTPTPIPSKADLIVSGIALAGNPVLNKDGSINVPLAVTILNRGGRTAERFKTAVWYRSRAGTYVAPFSAAGQGGWYPFVGSVAPGARASLRGAVTLPAYRQGETVTIWAEADSCSGEEFTRSYCRVDESNERNNGSRALSVQLPQRRVIPILPPRLDQLPLDVFSPTPTPTPIIVK